MKYYELDADEQDILDRFDKDEFVPSDTRKDIFVEAARETLNRNRQINIRISERDLLKLKARAAEKGLPYQTLISSVLHQYGNS